MSCGSIPAVFVLVSVSVRISRLPSDECVFSLHIDKQETHGSTIFVPLSLPYLHRKNTNDPTRHSPLMGSHYWNGATQPNLNVEPWEDPVWIMGSLDGAISLIEPMFPLTFVTGKVDREYNEELTYVSQTDKRLPFRYTVSYNAKTEFATITIVGKSALCGKEFRKAKRDHDNSKNPTKGDHS